MKGLFFNKPLEWSIEVQGESWYQGSTLQGKLTVKNHGTEAMDLSDSGVGLAFADIKKIHARSENALRLEQRLVFSDPTLPPSGTLELPFSITLPPNCPVTDKKSSYYLVYGRGHTESHLQLKIEPRELFSKFIGLMDTFFRFKLKEYKASKSGVEFKLLPPSSREMANIEALSLNFSLEENLLKLEYLFQVKKLDTAAITTKIQKESIKLSRTLQEKQYALGKGMINQDELLKSIEEVIAEVKLKSVF